MRKKDAFIITIGICLLFSCGNKQTKDDSQAISVRAEKVSSSTEVFGDVYSATIEEVSSSALSFGSTGTISGLNVKEGQMVSKGQVLASLDGMTQSNILESALSASDIAKESLSQAEDAYNRMKMLHDEGSLPDIQWVDVLTKLSQARSAFKAAQSQVSIAQKGVTDTHLIAPFSGYISSKLSDVGQQVAPGVPVVRLVNINQVKAKFNVPEAKISSIRQGQEMSVRLSSMPDEIFQGLVSEKSVSADPISHSYDVWILLSNPNHVLLPGMLCEVTPMYQKGINSIVIPAQYIMLDDDNKRFVWCLSSSKATRRYVTLGENRGKDVIISSGLSIGDSLITDGAQKVFEGALCKVIK